MAIQEYTITDISSSQAPYVTYNNLVSFVRACLYGVVDRDLTAPPGSPANDQMYIAAAVATGDWAGRENDLLWTQDGGTTWRYIVPSEGWKIWVVDENVFIYFNGSTWDTVDGSIDHNELINTHNLTTDIDHDTITNTHNLTTDIDHDALTNFVADEHIDVTSTFTQDDAQHIATDGIQARDGDGIYVKEDAGEGLTIADGGDATFSQDVTIKAGLANGIIINDGIFREGSNALKIGTNSVEHIRIGSAGKVGIGTTDPKTKLHSTTDTIVGCANAAQADGNLGASQVNIWQDETNDVLKFKGKDSASGVMTWSLPLTLTNYFSHTWTVDGEVTVQDLMNHAMYIASGRTVKLIACTYEIESGTSATFKLKKRSGDGAYGDITGFTSLSCTTTYTRTEPTAVTLADDDVITPEITAVSGTPTDMYITLHFSETWSLA